MARSGVVHAASPSSPVDDLEAAERAVLAMGGTTFDDQPAPDRSRVFADPAGHPFCLVPMRDRADEALEIDPAVRRAIHHPAS